MKEGGQFYCGVSDRIYRDRDKLRYAGSTPRHSSNQPEELLPETWNGTAAYTAEDGAFSGRKERTVENGVERYIKVFT